MIVRPYEHVQHRGEGLYLMVYRPAPRGEGNWAARDQWIGPFKPPGNGTLFRMTADKQGRVWFTGDDGLYCGDPKALLRQAETGGFGVPTERWRKEFEKRLEQADWQVRLRVLLARKEFRQSLDFVEAKLAEMDHITAASALNDRNAWAYATLHKAFVLACMERWDESLAVYTQVRGSETVAEPGRFLAAREAMWVLALAERWPEFLKEVEASGQKPMEGTALSAYVARARQEVDKASAQPTPAALPAGP